LYELVLPSDGEFIFLLIKAAADGLDRQLLLRLWFSCFGSWKTLSIGWWGFFMIDDRTMMT
jgi:hypothetical protein